MHERGRKIVKREHGVIDLQNEPDQNSERTHAKPGTFDESEFTDPNTGRFRFPRYKHDSERFLVKISDDTDYRDEYWDSMELDAEERREYGIRDFEDDFMDPDIEVDSFEVFFNKLSAKHRAPLTYLKGEWSIVEDLLHLDDDAWTIVDPQSAPMMRMVKDGCLFEQVANTDEQKMQYFGELLLVDLRAACKKTGIKPRRTKRETIDCMITSTKRFDLPPMVIPSPQFFEWFDKIVDLYIANIRANVDRFHPLYIRPIWEAARDANDIDAVGAKIGNVLESRYWLDRFAG